MKKLRWGLIGCGDIARKRVAPALRDLEHCEFIAVARAQAHLAAAFAQEFGANRWYHDWQELLQDTEIEAVYIATPVYLHAAQTIAAAQAGKHVLCEKPMALKTYECERMIATCEQQQVTLGVAYYRHFYPAIARVKEILSSGEIGAPVMVEMYAFERFEQKPGEARYWLLEKQHAGGGPMMDFGCHRIEVLQHLFGAVTQVQSQIWNLRFQREVEDTAYLSLVFEQQVHAILRVTHAVYETQDTLHIFGTKGSIHIPALNAGTILVKTEQQERTEQLPPHPNVHQPLIHDFTQAVLEGRTPVVHGRIGRDVTAILDQIYQ